MSITSEYDVTIDLSETDTKNYKDENFIQKQAKKSFIKVIEQFKVDYHNDSCHVHNSILINGKRGMGKSSFALHIANYQFQNLKIHPISIIDPTLIETREHIFLLIITQIKNSIDEYAGRQQISEVDFKGWMESLKKLAGGLSMIDGIGKNHLEDNYWDSPELVLEKGLNNSRHGFMLEKKFHQFVINSLKVLNKDAFLIIFDDIDTSLDKGIIILEVLRKYLTTPKIIAVLLGDIELYSTLVRQMQWKKIDPNKVLQEYEFDKNKEKYLAQIEHLEEQYLVKILKPENRIHLQTIHHLIEKIQIASQNNKSLNESIPLKKYSQEMMNTLFLSKRYTGLFEQTLYNQPTRSVIQVLKAYEDCEHTLKPEFVTKFHDVFYTTLYKQLSSFQLLDIESLHLMNLLGRYILANPSIDRDSNLELLPEYSNPDENVASVYINLLFNHNIQQKDYLSYFIKIGYALEQYNASIVDSKNIKSFISHIGLDSVEPNARIARRLLTTFKTENNKFKDSYNEFGNISCTVAQQNKFKNNQKVSLLLSKVYNPIGGKLGFLSFWNLLGVLADVNQAKNDKDAFEILKNNLMIRDYYLYSKIESKFDTDSNKEDQNEYQHETKDTVVLFEELSKWAIKIQNVEKLPLYVLAKIWVRIVYTFHEIDTRYENKQKTYLEVFLLYISAFLNAVFVQIELYNLSNSEIDSKLDIKNPSQDINFFKNKLFNYKIANGKNQVGQTIFENKYYTKKDNDYIATSSNTPWGEELYRKHNDSYISVKEDPKTLFEFLYSCPLFSKFENNFQELSNLRFNAKEVSDSALKTWGSIKPRERQDAIKALKAKNYGLARIQEYLSTLYKNVDKKTVEKIFDGLK